MNLSPEQQLAVDSTADPTVVIAGPGSGKTRILVERMVRLIVVDGVPPSAIRAITFTRKAADEIRHRVFNELRERTGRRNVPVPHVDTFHGWAAELLERFGSRFGYRGRVQLLNEADVHLVRKLNGRSSDEQTSAELKASNCIDYDGMEAFLEALPGELLAEVAPRHLLVDETQDLSEREARMVTRLAARSTLFLVGDPDQCIYEWRDADPDFLAGAADLAGLSGGLHTAARNYRSGPQIVALAGAMRHRDFGSGVDVGTEQQVRMGADLVVPHIADVLAELLDLGEAHWGTVAVLGRTWATLYRWQAQLEEVGIPTRIYSPARDAWSTSMGQLASYVLRLARDPHNQLLVRLLAAAAGVLPAHLAHGVAVATRTRQHLDQVLVDLGYLRFELVNGPLSARLAVALEAPALLPPDATPLKDFRVLGLHRFVSPAHDDLDLEAWYRWFTQRDAHQPIEDGNHVHLLTVHAAKGLEWDHVVIPDCDSHTYRDTDELGRLLFVAVTRARRSLCITWDTGSTVSPLIPEGPWISGS